MELSAILDESEAYGRAIGKMQFDMECCASEEGIDQAGADMAVLGRHVYELTHSERYQQLLCELYADSEGLNVNYYLDYLEDKYTRLYALQV